MTNEELNNLLIYEASQNPEFDIQLQYALDTPDAELLNFLMEQIYAKYLPAPNEPPPSTENSWMGVVKSGFIGAFAANATEELWDKLAEAIEAAA